MDSAKRENQHFRTEAERLCASKNVNFEQAFRYQYVVSSKDLELPGFRAHTAGNVILQTGSAIRCDPLTDSQGRLFGFFFGVGASHDGRSPSDYLCDGFDVGHPEAIEIFEGRLTYVAGRFGVVIFFQGLERLYVDACGMIGFVSNPENRRVAASPALCIDRPFVPHPLYHFAGTSETIGSFGLHFTIDESVVRVNANHYISLDTFETRRFWPREENCFHLTSDQYAESLDEIVNSSQQIVRRLISDNETSLPLSGGFDSRSILAITDHESRTRLDQISTHVLTWIGIVDAAVANQLCDLNGLGLEVHNALRERRFSGKSEMQETNFEFQIASSDFRHPPQFVVSRAHHKVKRDAVVLRGQQMPILRGLFVPALSDEEDWTPEFISQQFVKLLGLHEASSQLLDQILNSVRKLHTELPDNAKLRSMDLLLVESVNGPELASFFCGISQSFFLSPFNSRRLIQLFSSFNTEYRHSGLAMRLLLLRADPSMLSVAMTSQAKSIKFVEDDKSVKRRIRKMKRLLQEYRNVFGDTKEMPSMVRFRANGIVSYF